MSTVASISPDATLLQATLASLAMSDRPSTAYCAWRGAVGLVYPLLSPTQTSISRYLQRAAAGRARGALVRSVPVESSRADDGFQITPRGRDALHRALEAPLTTVSSTLAESLEVKLLLTCRFADGKHAAAFVAAQLEHYKSPTNIEDRSVLEARVVDPAAGSSRFLRRSIGVLREIERRRDQQRQHLVAFLEDVQRQIAADEE